MPTSHLPPLYVVTDRYQIGEEHFLRVLERLISQGGMMLQLRERDLFSWIHSKKTRTHQLKRVYFNSRWFKRYSLKLSLIQNGNLPPQIAYEIIDSLMRQDLVEVLNEETLSPVVRKRARKILQQKIEALSTDDRLALAEFAKDTTIDVLLASDDPQLLSHLAKNTNLQKRQVKALLDKDVPVDLESVLRDHPCSKEFFPTDSPTKSRNRRSKL